MSEMSNVMNESEKDGWVMKVVFEVEELNFFDDHGSTLTGGQWEVDGLANPG